MKKPAANVMFKTEWFSPKTRNTAQIKKLNYTCNLGTWEKYSPIQHYTEDFNQCIQVRKRNKKHQEWEKWSKLSLFIENIVMYNKESNSIFGVWLITPSPPLIQF